MCVCVCVCYYTKKRDVYNSALRNYPVKLLTTNTHGTCGFLFSSDHAESSSQNELDIEVKYSHTKNVRYATKHIFAYFQ